MADDVTEINGIGPERGRVLAERLDVRTVEDLARADADDIVEALERVSHRTATLWIATAQRRVAVRQDGWDIEAMFLVYVERRAGQRRTAVHLVGTDEEERWPGRATHALVDWMDEHVPVEVPAEGADDAPVALEAADDAPVALESADDADPLVHAMRLLHPPGAPPQLPRDDGNFHEVIEAHRAFALEAVVRSDVAPTGVRLRARRVGAPSPAWEELTPIGAPGGGPTDVVRFDTPGLPTGLYRLTVHDESSGAIQRGPLVLVD